MVQDEKLNIYIRFSESIFKIYVGIIVHIWARKKYLTCYLNILTLRQ